MGSAANNKDKSKLTLGQTNKGITSLAHKKVIKPRSSSKKEKAGEISDSADELSDSDPEVIEGTPEAKSVSVRGSIIKSTKIGNSPDFIPSTPHQDVTRTSSFAEKSSLNLGSLRKLSSSTLHSSTLMSKKSSNLTVPNVIRPAGVTMKGKSKLSRLSKKIQDLQSSSLDKRKSEILKDSNGLANKVLSSVKRPAMTGTGVSPDPKRTNVPEIIVPKEEVVCKSNLLSKFDNNSFTSDAESDGSFSILLPERKKENKENIMNAANSPNNASTFDDKFDDEILELDTKNDESESLIKEEDRHHLSPPSKEGQKFNVKTENESLSSLKEEKEIASEILSASQGFIADVEFEEDGDQPAKKDPSLIPETQDMFEDSLDHMFDDDLACDFEKMSPFKQEVAQAKELPIENK